MTRTLKYLALYLLSTLLLAQSIHLLGLWVN